MEAVPKVPMYSFEMKISPEPTHFGPKLKQFIADAYKEDPENYGKEIHMLDGLRASAVRPATDQSGISALVRYLCQLRAMQSRFPMAKGQPASVNFIWRDLYACMNCTSADIRFELACILYNIGALHTLLGESEPRTTPESLKAACTHYQQAAWAFQYMREHYPQPHGVDVSPDIMRLFQEICFAMAQECIMEKSIQDTKKPSVIGAVATQVMAFYKNSLAILGPSTGSDNIHEIVGTKVYNHFHRYMSFKHAYVSCIVYLYQGMNAEEQQKMGERVAFFQHAAEKLAEARKLQKYIEPAKITADSITFINDVVEGKKKAAKNENEFIYHEEIPDKNLLTDLKPVCLVKALPINFNDPEVSGPDIFARLIPMGAHEASSLYSEEKAKLLRQIVDQAEIKNTEVTEFLSSLQLDQLEVLNSEQKIPQEIVDRCAAMNAKTEIIQSLVDSMNNLAEIISDVETALADCKTFIQEETAKEKEYQKVIGPRPPSIVQTELSREFNKYQEAHTRTNESNQVLHKAMTLHIANLRLLAQPLETLEAKIPSIDNIEGLDRHAMAETRRVVGKTREMLAQRSSLVQQLRADLTADDITGALLAACSTTADEIFHQEIQKHAPKVKIIEQNLAAQENIINRLTSLYASYGESRRLLSEVLRKRDGLINALITSYDTYEELLGKSQKGLEFYKKLSHNVNQLLARLRSTCQVQEEERAQLLSKQKSTPAVVPSKIDDITPTHVPASSSETPHITSGKPTLKDYLPYMKSRGFCRSVPQAPPEALPTEAYYPESIYPTSIRPAPVGSEATIDTAQTNYHDGYAMPPSQNPYNPYANQYAPTDTNPYTTPNNYGYSAPGRSYDVPKVNENDGYGYNTPYTPPQISGHLANAQQIIYNPYYTATQDHNTAVTDSQSTSFVPSGQANINPNASQYNPYNDPYAIPTTSMQTDQVPPVQEIVNSIYATGQQSDLSMNFGQMHVSQPKPDNKTDSAYGSQYSNTFYSLGYPQVPTPNNSATYSHAPQTSGTALVPSQVPTEYNSLNYPYSGTDQTVPASQSFTNPNPANVYNAVDAPYSYNSTANFEANSYPMYSVADNASVYSANTVTSNIAVSVPQPYDIPDNAVLSQLEALDKPIKSHTTGEALSTYPYRTNVASYHAEQSVPQSPSNPQMPYADQAQQGYGQTYQNHPGYTHNIATGNFDYNYGSQNAFSSYNNSNQGIVNSQSVPNDPNWTTPGVYTSAGTYETVQSPSEVPQMSQNAGSNNQIYYNTPYGYQTMQPNETVPNTQSATNYGADVNQSTYMQSGQGNNSAVTYSSNQVSTPKEGVTDAPNFDQNQGNLNPTSDYQNPTQNFQNPQSNETPSQNYQNPPQNYPNTPQNYQTPQENYQTPPQTDHNASDNQNTSGNYQNPPNSQTTITSQEAIAELPNQTIESQEQKKDLTAFDLLSDIDFSVEYTPLKPEIKVPQISESAIKKPIYMPKEEVPKPVKKVEELLERPAKMDLFTDPALLNKFTEEVKNMQKMVDGLWSFNADGSSPINVKWKVFQEVQANENKTRSKTIARRHSSGNSTDVVPYDDSRLTLVSNPNTYLNASYYKQLASWCIPLVISKLPDEEEFSVYWKAILENKIGCVVCLLSELEMTSKPYWPKAKGQTLQWSDLQVTLDELTNAFNWIERRLTVSCGGESLSVTHFQIRSFPAKIACAPLVLLADKVLSQTYANRLSNQLSPAWVHCLPGSSRSAIVALVLAAMCQVRAGQLNLCEMLDEACINLFKRRTNVLTDTKDLADAYRTVLFYVQGALCSGTTAFNGETLAAQSSNFISSGFTPAPKDKENKMKFSRESFEEMKQSPGLKTGDMKDPLNFLDPLWSLKKK